MFCFFVSRSKDLQCFLFSLSLFFFALLHDIVRLWTIFSFFSFVFLKNSSVFESLICLRDFRLHFFGDWMGRCLFICLFVYLIFFATRLFVGCPTVCPVIHIRASEGRYPIMFYRSLFVGAGHSEQDSFFDSSRIVRFLFFPFCFYLNLTILFFTFLYVSSFLFLFSRVWSISFLLSISRSFRKKSKRLWDIIMLIDLISWRFYTLS